jgi:hypothetical protein
VVTRGGFLPARKRKRERINREIIVRLGNLRILAMLVFLGVPKLLIFSKLSKPNVENIRFWCGVMGSIRF